MKYRMKNEEEIVYQLWEIDIVYWKKLKMCGKITNLQDARSEAKKLALGWCEDDSELRQEYDVNDERGLEIWIGDSDFGVLIKKIKS